MNLSCRHQKNENKYPSAYLCVADIYLILDPDVDRFRRRTLWRNNAQLIGT